MARKSAMPPVDEQRGGPVDRFEAAMAELEGIVARMEGGELPLDESLKEFERGVALTKICRDSLAVAELRVKKLLGESDTAPQTGPDSPPDVGEYEDDEEIPF